jgi:hypothetical protein
MLNLIITLTWILSIGLRKLFLSASAKRVVPECIGCPRPLRLGIRRIRGADAQIDTVHILISPPTFKEVWPLVVPRCMNR